MGVVHHAVHVQWLGNARSDWCRALGLPYTKLEEQGSASHIGYSLILSHL